MEQNSKVATFATGFIEYLQEKNPQSNRNTETSRSFHLVFLCKTEPKWRKRSGEKTIGGQQNLPNYHLFLIFVNKKQMKQIWTTDKTQKNAV